MPLCFKRISLLLFVLLWTALCAAEDRASNTIEVTTEFTQKSAASESKDKARALALFGAKIKAVNLAAKYLTHKGLLEHYGNKQGEVFCLVANEIKASIDDEKFNRNTNSYYIRIKSKVTIADFIRAQNRDAVLGENESNFSFTREMEQPASKDIDPGVELSRAYRTIRQKHWRISVIYLHHLEKKYPLWGEVFLAKAIVFYGMDDTEKMIAALKAACSLNNQEACHELQSFSAEPG